jgi:hypothetical protein
MRIICNLVLLLMQVLSSMKSEPGVPEGAVPLRYQVLVS